MESDIRVSTDESQIMTYGTAGGAQKTISQKRPRSASNRTNI
ncbi:hypothetical protein LOSG293_020170 [Secundilactobacillus oryzae JCM 18671]|uniref:Uncharacterized protein n=1 Tax=Secundilactobacillus oryzae JCM 18671 TaxID=1291743 RepID=A0A081BGB1_9LACO|nr:hypothetical protein [Secundilactobacillus oryzae]GAK47079.1 hypothetical protein LOSG293_020170 [Secundilactobacillus oryzae JCM 18671]